MTTLHAIKDDRQNAQHGGELLRRINAMRAELGELLQEIELHIDDQHQHAKESGDIDEQQRLQECDAYRWHADAKHSLQAGVMFAERAVKQPTTF